MRTRTSGSLRRSLRIAALGIAISGTVAIGSVNVSPAVAADSLAGTTVSADSSVAAAAAATGCPGSLVNQAANAYGELDLYYSATSAGTTCAKMVHQGSTYGVASDTMVNVIKCKQTVPGNLCTAALIGPSDEGNYAYYAGPVSITGTAGHCVNAYGRIGSRNYATSPEAANCG